MGVLGRGKEGFAGTQQPVKCVNYKEINTSFGNDIGNFLGQNPLPRTQFDCVYTFFWLLGSLGDFRAVGRRFGFSRCWVCCIS